MSYFVESKDETKRIPYVIKELICEVDGVVDAENGLYKDHEIWYQPWYCVKCHRLIDTEVLDEKES